MVIIGDVHGNFDTLQALIAQFPKDQKICFVGDLIDRGPKSREVVEFVKAQGHDCVRGNHEVMMYSEGDNPKFSGIWIPNGGLECMESYKDLVRIEDYDLPCWRANETLFKEHMEWMRGLPLYIEYPDVKNTEDRHLVISHSSVSHVWHWTEKRKTEQKAMFEESILWNRSPPQDVPNIYNVFGHTPQQHGPRITKIYANVDTGCFYKKAGYGNMTALQFPEMIVYTQPNIDVPRERL